MHRLDLRRPNHAEREQDPRRLVLFVLLQRAIDLAIFAVWGHVVLPGELAPEQYFGVATFERHAVHHIGPVDRLRADPSGCCFVQNAGCEAKRPDTVWHLLAMADLELANTLVKTGRHAYSFLCFGRMLLAFPVVMQRGGHRNVTRI
jgi:hypothetical protein